MGDSFGQKPQLLDKWLLEQPADQFPPDGGLSYTGRFQSVSGVLNSQVHPHVEKGAIMAGEGFLTDHGPKHIETVINRASWLLFHPVESYPQLSAYEVYILLMAIHFHDVGNIFGRDEHGNKTFNRNVNIR